MPEPELTKAEVRQLVALLKRTSPVPHIPRAAFVPLCSKVVPAAVEVAVVKNGKVLLVPRSDEYAHQPDALHFPGSIMGPEDCQAQDQVRGIPRTADRVLREEVGAIMEKGRTIGEPKVLDGGEVRFAACSILVLVTNLFKEPDPARAWQWEWVEFEEPPPARLIPVHRPLWTMLWKHWRNNPMDFLPSL